MSTADHILDQIDTCLGDYTVSDDAMRCTPDLPPLPAVPSVRFLVVSFDDTDFRERLGQVQDSLRRMAEAFQPAAENAAKAVDNFTRALSAPAWPNVPGRPAWQSPYGPAQRQR